MQSHCWHARFVALPPQLRQMVAEIVSAPTFSSTSPLTTSTFPSTRPFSHCAQSTGRRTFSSSCRSLKLAQKSASGPRQTTRTKPASPSKSKTASSKSSKSSKTTKSPKSTSKKTPPPKTKIPEKKERRLSPLVPTDHVRALSFIPPLPSGESYSKTKLTPEEKAAAQAAAAASVRQARTPTSAALDRASSLFLRPEPEFLYSAPRFLNLPVNTRIPEVCILGRSNVGKSTLLNALAGLESGGKAGSSHGSRTSRLGLAITSAKAGCTTMMNGYGFGPPLKASQFQVFERVEAEEERKRKEGVPEDPRKAVVSRSQKRAQKSGEPAPAHSLVLIDMPGYGFMSRSEWGAEINKYLVRRGTLRGAVLLVDAVAGLKDGDLMALGMLRDANVRTTIVLTKADKLLPPKLLKVSAEVATTKRMERKLATSDTPIPFTPEPAFESGDSEGEQALRTRCLGVWNTLRRVERGSFGETMPWKEGQGWMPEIVVTGAGDPEGGGFGVAGARLAICRMAGLITKEAEAALPGVNRKQRRAAAAAAGGASEVGASEAGASGGAANNTVEGGVTADAADAASSDAASSAPTAPKVVPYDQIKWSTTATETVLDQSLELAFISQQEISREEQKARRTAAATYAEARAAKVAEGEEAGEEADFAEEDVVEDALAEPKAVPTRGRSQGRSRAWKRG